MFDIIDVVEDSVQNSYSAILSDGSVRELSACNYPDAVCEADGLVYNES